MCLCRHGRTIYIWPIPRGERCGAPHSGGLFLGEPPHAGLLPQLFRIGTNKGVLHILARSLALPVPSPNAHMVCMMLLYNQAALTWHRAVVLGRITADFLAMKTLRRTGRAGSILIRNARATTRHSSSYTESSQPLAFQTPILQAT